MKLLRSRLGALVAAAALLTAAPAFAQSAEQLALGKTVSHQILTLVDMPTLMAKGVQSGLKEVDFMSKIRPNWAQLLADSMNEEIAADTGRIEDAIGVSLAKGFTLEELRAGRVILDDPDMQAAMRAGVQGRPAPKEKNPPCGRPCMQALGAPAGMSFLKKLSALQTVFNEDLKNEILAIILPGSFRRFGEKAEAAERARTAAR